uniref:RNA polymerase II associated protein 1 n=1 Tax=Gouania willdenowi TaxID=441366 RepID=A0A8C5N5T0_GOUWI
MLRRPKPTDSEADILREQNQFLTSGAPSAASVVRHPVKRRGEAGKDGGHREESQKDVVTIEDLPDELPSLTPAPPKKSKATRVAFEDEDAEERLDTHDHHLTAVLSRIVERDTSSVPVSLPAFTGMAFPKVLHRSQTTVGFCVVRFTQQLGCTFRLFYRLLESWFSSGPRLVSGQGLPGPNSTVETMRIHRENRANLQGMSQSEIVEEQKKLLSQLDPRLVEFVRSRTAQSFPLSASTSTTSGDKRSENDQSESSESKPLGVSTSAQKTQEVQMDEEDGQLSSSRPVTKVLPVNPQKEWVHMDKVESEKLEWMSDLPAPRRKGTEKAMQARFDFAGTLIPPAEDLPTHLGLHHHGEEPERAGYSLQELFLLSRSQIIQQRCLALSTLANILSKARAGQYRSVLTGSVLSTLLDAGLLFLLRFALDDGVEGGMSAAVHALNALLVCSEDEECLDTTFSWFRGMVSFPLLPSAQDEEDDEDDPCTDEILKETAKEKEERKSDQEVATKDVVKGLFKMKLLPRLRYILEVVRPSPPVVEDILEILTRIARHSSSSATQLLDCPRLMGTVMTEFVPTSWTASSVFPPQSVYGLPLHSAVKLLRVLATSGRHACARVVTARFCAEPSELLLESSEAFRVTTEAYRLWAVATAYGQACFLFFFLSRSSSVVCNVESVHRDPESAPALPGLACSRWRTRPGLAVPDSPFPLLTGLGLLLETITRIHKGLCSKVSVIQDHFLSSQVPLEPKVALYASLYHQVALVLLSWLLPGSEFLAHELLSTTIFSKDFISEGHSGGPEAVELGELKLNEEPVNHTSPSLHTVGALLREACTELPSIRGCFLTHLAHLDSSVLSSRDSYLGRNPWVKSHLLPELSGPILPLDWPFLPLISLYERAGMADGGGRAVEELPHGALQAVTNCLQWLLLLEVWRGDALKVIPPVAKLARLSCIFLCSSDLFLERPVQRLTWGLFRLLTRTSCLDSLDLNVAPPGLASFEDLYLALLSQYEAVSLGDRLFGCWVLLPLQRRYSTTMRLAVFGEHVGTLRSLGVPLDQLSIPIERFTSPPEDSLPLLHLYFRALVTRTLKPSWCPVLYVVALSHINSFIFSQDAAAQFYGRFYTYVVNNY